MRRRLLNLLTALSLLLCVAAVALGMRDRDQFLFKASGRLWWVMWGVSRVRVSSVEGWPGAVPPRWITDPSTQSKPLVGGAGWRWPDTTRDVLGVTVRPRAPYATIVQELQP